MIASVVAGQLAPVSSIAQTEMLAKNEAIRRGIMLVSPATLFENNDKGVE